MLSKNLGIRSLIQMTIAIVICAAVIIWQLGFIRTVYFSKGQPALGLIINGTIILIFIGGVVKLALAFLHYSFEEHQVELFIRGLKNGTDMPAPDSILARRYETIKQFYEKQIPINHSAMASIMLAEESLYQSFPRFVNNILILLGVFGTIISLILALAGASEILADSVAGQGMWQIIHGMNIALTSTATAIVCFFFFTFFFHKLTDVQTYVFSKIEETVQTYIVPQFSLDMDSINYKTDRLISELELTVKELRKSAIALQGTFDESKTHNISLLSTSESIASKQDSLLDKTGEMLQRLDSVSDILKEGFRLKSDDE